MRHIAVSLLIVFVFAADASARVSRICKVAYETQLGRSEDHRIEVTFMTGRELNRATRSYDYESFANYALIWFRDGEVVILKLERLAFGIGAEFDNEDFVRFFRIISDTEGDQVNAPSGRRWRIKAKDFIRFIDPRADE